ncbi:hypothetical protein FRC15_003656 [Serendipita sp. 397]|nr:hypothetical protein FRC15_003656 [Serendipita sp. 397]
MPLFKGFSINVVCKGTVLKEYDPKVNSQGNSVGCWIASESNAEFILSCAWATAETCAWKFVLHCDGNQLTSKLSRPDQTSQKIKNVEDLRFQRALVFSDVGSVESKKGVKNPNMGMIEVVVFRIRPFVTLDPIVPPVELPQLPSVAAKHIGGHRVTLGPPIPASKRYATADHLDSFPYITFKFYYRRRDVLQAMGKIPPPVPAPQPSNASPVRANHSDLTNLQNEDSEVDSDEAEEIIAKIHSLTERLRKRRRVGQPRAD